MFNQIKSYISPKKLNLNIQYNNSQKVENINNTINNGVQSTIETLDLAPTKVENEYVLPYTGEDSLKLEFSNSKQKDLIGYLNELGINIDKNDVVVIKCKMDSNDVITQETFILNGGTRLVFNKTDDGFTISSILLENGEQINFDNGNLVISEDQKNNFLNSLDSLKVDVNNSEAVLRVIEKGFPNMSKDDREKFMTLLNDNYDRFKPLLQQVINQYVTNPQGFEDKFGVSLYSMDIKNGLFINMEEIYPTLVNSVFKNYYGATNINDIISYSQLNGKKYIDLPNANTVNSMASFTDPNENIYTSKSYYGQCTWFAAGMFRELYGYKAPFSNDGGECVGNIYNSLVRDQFDFYNSNQIANVKPASIFSYSVPGTHVGMVLDVDVNNNKIVIAEGNLGKDGLPPLTCNNNAVEGINDSAMTTYNLNEWLSQHPGVSFASPKANISTYKSPIENLTLSDILK